MTEATKPFEGLYDFVRSHLAVVNNLIAFSCASVAALDFLTPKLWLLPRLVYTCTTALAIAMLIAAFVPSAAAKIHVRFLGSTPSHLPLWRRGGWQFSCTLLCIVSFIGFASIARAGEGGLAASVSPSIRSLQEELLSLRAGLAEIKEGVDQTHAKLDRIAESVDPAHAADRCADLECAIHNGASGQAIRKLFAKGAKVPGDAPNAGALLVGAATSQSADRLDAVELLIRNGIPRDLPLLPILLDPAALTKTGALNAKRVFDQASLEAEPGHRFRPKFGDPALDHWNSVAGCLMRASGGMTLIEFAALQGDLELVDSLATRGVRFPSRALLCRWGSSRRSGAAQVEFSEAGAMVRISAL